MEAHVNLTYEKAFTIAAALASTTLEAGRQLAHAMAHGYYGCRKYVIKYGEGSGMFSIVSGD